METMGSGDEVVGTKLAVILFRATSDVIGNISDTVLVDLNVSVVRVSMVSDKIIEVGPLEQAANGTIETTDNTPNIRHIILLIMIYPFNAFGRQQQLSVEYQNRFPRALPTVLEEVRQIICLTS